MTTQTRPKPTSMIVCDICDDEIERDADGSDGRANLMTRVSPIVQVADTTRHGILSWGRRRIDPQDDPMPSVHYDFHGRCIAELIQREIDARKVCGHCKGSGFVQGRHVGEPVACTVCHGTGRGAS